jgi:hypothetical protein
MLLIRHERGIHALSAGARPRGEARIAVTGKCWERRNTMGRGQGFGPPMINSELNGIAFVPGTGGVDVTIVRRRL